MDPWDDWSLRWAAAAEACAAKGGEIRPLRKERPATESEVADIERRLGIRLPFSLRRVLLGYARQLEFSWWLPKPARPPHPFRGIFSGGCNWSVDRLTRCGDRQNGWPGGLFPDPNHPYDRVWHGKLTVTEVPNGDFIGIDLEDGDDGSVYYLSHDDGEGHGYHLGENFIDFVDRFSLLGCPG